MAERALLVFIILFTLFVLPSVSFAYRGSKNLYGGAYWKCNKYKYNTDFKATTDFQKSWDLNNDGWLSGNERKMMKSSPTKWGPSEWPPKKISR